MDLEELKERYKMLPMWARLLVAALIGLIPGGLIYYDEGDTLQAQLVTSQGNEEGARAKFEEARRQKANLPQLEEQLEFTDQQLTKAKKRLPDSYRIEDVLQKTATIAKEVGVRMAKFDPGAEIPHRDSYRYVEMPIKTELSGRFAEVVAFFDRVVHLESSIFLQRIVLERAKLTASGDNEVRSVDTNGKTPFQIAKESRQDLKIKATFDLVIFRGMSEAEASAPDPEGLPTMGPDGLPVPPVPQKDKPKEEDPQAQPANVAPPGTPPPATPPAPVTVSAAKPLPGTQTLKKRF